MIGRVIEFMLLRLQQPYPMSQLTEGEKLAPGPLSSASQTY
jgi:hypothetical protein